MTIILYVYRRKKNDKDDNYYNTVTYVHHEGLPSELESSDKSFKPGDEYVSHESSNTDDNNSNKPKSSEPTYFELERRDGVTGTGTSTNWLESSDSYYNS